MKLSVVGLPIGNIEDISYRAIQTISEAQLVVCEDTRMFNNLWTKLVQLEKAVKFEGRVRFLNDFNEERFMPRIIAEMTQLERVVLVSDAGMPLISDPGFKLVRESLRQGWDVDVVPGPTAESAALAMSGLPTDKAIFLGFLPKKPGKRLNLLTAISSLPDDLKMTTVIYESPARLLKLLREILQVFGEERDLFVGFDLTKSTQRVYRGTAIKVIEALSKERIKGEITIVLGK